MAIITEYYSTRSDGVILDRTYSDKQMMIERDGIMYSEAIDPRECGRVYVETYVPIVDEEYANLDQSQITDNEFLSMLEEVL